jgi:hypothetical protein
MVIGNGDLTTFGMMVRIVSFQLGLLEFNGIMKAAKNVMERIKMKVRSIPCEMANVKGWTIFYGKKLLGFICKISGGTYKYQCQTYSPYGPSFYSDSKKECIEKLIEVSR